MTAINVMVIDDDELDRYLATRTLNSFDVFESIVELPDGQDAAELIQSPEFIDKWGPLPPTLIFLDINMPRMTGFQFLDYLTTLPEDVTGPWTGYVILMLTSSGNLADKERAESYDLVKGYIEKPITAEKVQAILKENYSSLDDIQPVPQ